MLKRVLAIWMLSTAAAAAQDAKPVQAQELAALLSPITRTAPAEVVSANRSRLSARIEARIDAMHVDVGDTVEKGQAVVSLDCSDHELALQSAEATLQSASARLQRARQLVARSESLAKKTLISPDLLEQRQTEEQAAQAETQRARVALQQAELAIDRCRVTSPFDAVVTERLAGLGELARPGTPLLELVDVQTIEVSAQVTPDDQDALRASPRLYFRYLDAEHDLRIARLVPVIDPVTRTIEVRLTFTAGGAPVGASGRLVWHDQPGIPAGLVLERDGQYGIFLARDGRAVFHPLPGAEEGRPAAVSLADGTLVVTDGRRTLRDGDAITVVD